MGFDKYSHRFKGNFLEEALREKLVNRSDQNVVFYPLAEQAVREIIDMILTEP